MAILPDWCTTVQASGVGLCRNVTVGTTCPQNTVDESSLQLHDRIPPRVEKPACVNNVVNQNRSFKDE